MATRTLEVVFLGDTKSIDRAFGRVSTHASGLAQHLEGVGKRIHAVGKRITEHITLPVAIAGTAAGKMALDYEESMAKVARLTGASEKQVASWKDALLRMAGEVGKSPQELAEGLYFVASAGIDAKDALNVLEVAAKASTAGLGTTQTIADALTSAIGAYGEENLSAAHAADVLTGAVKYGKGEASAMAKVFGRVAPSAAQMGVSFDEVGGALASMSNLGGSMDQWATRLVRVIATFQKPTGTTADALHRMGLSVEEVQRRIAKRGLLNTMHFLEKRMKGTGVAIGDVFPNIRALQGFLALTGKNAGKTRKVFDEVNHSAGAMSEAFRRAEKTSRGRFDRAFSKLKADATELGESFLKIAVPATEKFADALGAIADLPGPMRAVIVGAVALVAALGPLLIGLGLTVKWTGEAIAGFKAMQAAMLVMKAKALPLLVANFIRLRVTMMSLRPVAAAAFGPIGIAVMALVTVGILVATHWKQTKAILSAVWSALKNAAQAAFHAIGWAAKNGLLGPIPFIIARWHELPGIFSKVLHAILSALKAAGSAFLAGGKWLVNRIVAGVKAAADAVLSAGSWLVHRWLAGARAEVGAIRDVGGWLVGRVVAFVHDGAGRVLDIGTWIVHKIADGILAGPKIILKAAEDFVTHLVNAVKDKLGIHSPSRVFHDIGQHVIGGLIRGMHAGDILGFATGHFGSLVDIAKSLLVKGLLKVPGMALHEALNLAKGGLGALKDGISGILHGLFGGGHHMPHNEQLASWLSAALAITGHYSKANLGALYRRALQESGGNPRAINLWDSNAKAGHPSKGLLQTIDSTFNAYRIKGLGNIWNPIANAVAAIRYMYANYGHIVDANGRGYAQGGVVRVRMGELGPEDAYLPVGTRVVQASESGRGDGPLVKIEHATFTDQADPVLFARELAWQIATR